jgi:PEP-CTERM motif
MFIKRTAFIAFLGLSGLPQAQAINLPSGSCSVSGSCLTYGDFNVYSMAFLNVQAGYGAPNGNDPYNVQSSPGQISDGVVFGTGASGTGLYENFSGMNNAYETPSGNAVSFSTGGTPSATAVNSGSSVAPPPISNPNGTWNADISALHNFLAGPNGGGDFTPYFNLNETKNGADTLAGIDLLIWVHMFVDNGLASTDAGYLHKDFYLWGNPLEFGGNGTNTTSAVGPNANNLNNLAADQTAYDKQWAYVHGTICADNATGTVLGFGPCTAGQKAAGGSDIDQNLGANNAAFAVYNKELNDIIKGAPSLYTAFHMDWRMSAEDNGFEQGFLANNTKFSDTPPPPPSVPEPFTLALLGLGLLGMSRKLLV